MINAKKRFLPGQSSTYELILKNLHDILMNEVQNKYLQSFLGVEEYIEKNLQDKVWDVKLFIHATTSTQQLIDQGHLNAPTVDGITIRLPSDDTTTQKHMRYILQKCTKTSSITHFDISVIPGMLLLTTGSKKLQITSQSFHTITELMIH